MNSFSLRIATIAGLTLVACAQPNTNSSPTKVLLTLQPGIGGSLVASPQGQACTTCEAGTTEYVQGTSVTITAVPSTGYSFTGFTGDCSGMTCQLVMGASHLVGATFTPVSHQLTITRTGPGVISSSPSGVYCGDACTASFSHGTSIQLTATPDNGATFAGWGGACSGAGPCTVTLTADTTVTASFTTSTYSVTVMTTGSGTGQITSIPAGIDCGSTCTASFNAGTMVVLTATPSATSVFSGWSGDCSGLGACVVPVDGAHAVTAQFDPASVSLTVATFGGGTIASSDSDISCGTTCQASYPTGSMVTLTATPSDGNSFTGWSGACAGATGATCQLTLDQSATVVAGFAPTMTGPALDTLLTNGPANPSRLTSATFWFTGTAAASFVCSLDGATPAACTSPATYSGLADGIHTFSVAAVDAEGNVDATPATYTWTIITQPPVTTITSTPPNPSNDQSPSFTFTSTAEGSTFSCRVDTNTPVRCTSPYALSGLPDGSHIFVVTATDPAGNTDPTPPSYSWTIDTVPPVTSFTDTPPNPSNQPSPTFSFQANKPTSAYRCSLDGAAATACSSPTQVGPLADGLHTFTVAATDLAGNTDPNPATYSWTIDTVAPVTTITSAAPPPLTNQTSFTFTFTSTKPGTFTCTLTNVGMESTSITNCTSPQTYSGLSDGLYAFSVSATDNAGNTDANPPSVSWTIDTVPPYTNITSEPPNPSNNASPSFAFQCSKASCTWVCALDGASQACTSPAGYSHLADGSHTFTVAATDGAGNTETNPPSYTWTLDTLPPADPTGLTATPGNRQVSLSWTAVGDATQYTVYYGAGNLNSTLTTGSNSLIIGSLSNCVTYSFAVTATDAATNQSSQSPPVAASPTLPASTASAVGAGGVINVSWSSVPNASSYQIAYGTTKGGPYTGTDAVEGASPFVASGTSAALHGFAPSQTHYLTVTPYDGTCAGTASAELASSPYPWRWVNPLPTGADLHAADCNGSTCVALGEDGTALRSTNGGVAWTQANAGTVSSFLDVQLMSATTGFALSSGNTYATNNGGVTWLSTTAPPSATWYSLRFTDTQHGWIVGAQGAVAMTANGGSSWTSQTSGTGGDLYSIWMVDANNGYAVGQQGGIVKTTNGGTLWRQQASPTTANLRSVTCTDATHCWAVGDSGAIVATSDGTTWTSLNSSGPSFVRIRMVSASAGWATGTSGAVYVTANGTSFTAQTSGETDSLFGLAATDATHALIVGGGGIIRTTSDGSTWTSQKTSLATTTLRAGTFLDANNGVFIGDSGLELRTSDGGQTFQTVSTGTTASLEALSFVGTTGYASGTSGTLLKSLDGGKTWTPEVSGVPNELDAIFCIDANTCWTAGTGAARYTVDGTTWNAEVLGASVKALFFVPGATGYTGFAAFENTCFGGSCYTGVAKTTNSGSFWGTMNFYSDGRALYFKDASHGWMAGAAGYNGCGSNTTAQVFVTSNGTSWNVDTSTSFSRGCLYGMAYVSDSEMYGAGYQGILTRRTASGWSQLPAVSNRWDLYAAIQQAPGTAWAIGQNGTILQTVTGGQ